MTLGQQVQELKGIVFRKVKVTKRQIWHVSQCNKTSKASIQFQPKCLPMQHHLCKINYVCISQSFS